MKANLSPKQQKIFEMLLNNIPPKEIAYNLHITYNTLLYHQKQLYRKLDVHSVHELIEKYAPAAKDESVITIAPESGVTVQEDMTGGWLDKLSGEVEVRKKTLPVKWFVIFGILLFAGVLLFILFVIQKPTNEGFPAVFYRWNTWTDNTGSSVNITVTHDDVIDGEYFTSYTMSGVLSGVEGWYTVGIALYPVPLTHRAMKRMTSFSFKVLGDGKLYRVNIPTTDTMVYDRVMDHYLTMFPTVNGQISTITINVDDLMQQGYGKQVPFIRNNIVFMEFAIGIEFFTESSEPFNLKVWDIRICK